MTIDKSQIIYTNVKEPSFSFPNKPVYLTAATMAERKAKLLEAMRKQHYETVIIYGDREHHSNFSYLTGFATRFEEALIVLHQNGTAYLLLGNENKHMIEHSFLQAELIHVPYFSLPNQPMDNDKPFIELLKDSQIKKDSKVGLIGWKLFTSNYENNKYLYDIPFFIVDAVCKIVGDKSKIENACDIMISPDYGIRTTVNVNEIAYYEFGAALASSAMLKMLDKIQIGMNEMELASELEYYGKQTTVQTICASGERFTDAVIEPRNKVLEFQEKFSSTIGYCGGLSNRSGYLVEKQEQLVESVKDYLNKVVKPYYMAAVTWYSELKLGMTGQELYEIIENILPKEIYGWYLNPGHFIASEEWMSSPISKTSKTIIRSGMMLQLDIIVKVKGYGDSNAEDGVVVADKEMREKLKVEYPEVWNRMMERKKYMKNELGIVLHDEILPLSNINGYLRPFLLNRQKAMKVKN